MTTKRLTGRTTYREIADYIRRHGDGHRVDSEEGDDGCCTVYLADGYRVQIVVDRWPRGVKAFVEVLPPPDAGWPRYTLATATTTGAVLSAVRLAAEKPPVARENRGVKNLDRPPIDSR